MSGKRLKGTTLIRMPGGIAVIWIVLSYLILLCMTFRYQVLFNSQLFHQFDFTRAPGFLNPGLKRSVHPQRDKPAFPRHGCKPVVLKTFRWLRRKVDIVRAVLVLPETFGL